MTTQIETPAHIIEEANKMVAMGTKMPFDKIVEMFMKREAKKGNGMASKKDIEKMESRKRVSEMEVEGNASEWLAAKNRENAMKNLPSSLR